MKILKDKTELGILSGPTALTVGKFDCIHRGHDRILQRLSAKRAEGLISLVFTFSKSPRLLLNAGREDDFHGRNLITNAERTEPVLMVGPKGLARVVSSLRVIAPELPFEIQFLELTEREQEISLPGEKDFHIHAFRVNHNVPCYGYAFSLDRAGRFDAARAKDQGIPLKLWSRLQKGETIETEEGTYTPDMVLGPARKGLSLVYTTDTRPCENIVKYAQGADLLICEGMYGEPDKAEKAKEHKHMTFTEAARIAKKAGPAQMWLTHYSPSLVRPDEFMPQVRKIFPDSLPGKDGKTITLAFDKEE